MSSWEVALLICLDSLINRVHFVSHNLRQKTFLSVPLSHPRLFAATFGRSWDTELITGKSAVRGTLLNVFLKKSLIFQYKYFNSARQKIASYGKKWNHLNWLLRCHLLFVSWKFCHNLLFANLATRWRHLHKLQIWLCHLHCHIAYWHHQLVLGWYLYQPESHQLSLQKVS